MVDCAVYVDGRRLPGRYSHTDALEVARREGGFVWLGLHEPTEAGFAEVASTFGLDELAVEQAVTAGHRPKIERSEAETLFVLRTTRYVEHSELTDTAEVVETGEILIFVGDRFVITVRHGAPGALGTVRADLEQRPELLAQGPWAVAYAVCDRVVDSYLEVAGAGGDRRRRRGGARLRPSCARPDRAHLPAQTRADRVQAGGRAAAAADGRAGRGQGTVAQGHPPLLPRRQRPPAAHGGAGQPPTTTCSTRFCRPGWRRSPSTRTTTCARSQRGRRSPRPRPRSPASTA